MIATISRIWRAYIASTKLPPTGGGWSVDEPDECGEPTMTRRLPRLRVHLRRAWRGYVGDVEQSWNEDESAW